jgi:1-phosphofructokinase family hexose kinase
MVRAAATLGARAAVVAILGGPTGEMLHRALEAAGIQVVVVPTPAETRTCVAIASADTGTLTELYATAAAVPSDVWQEFRAGIRSTLAERPGWLSICGGAPAGLASEAIADLVRLGADSGVSVAVDTHGVALRQAVAAAPALVKINRFEAAELLGLPADEDLLIMARAIREQTGGAVVLTDSIDGALAVDGAGATHARIPTVAGQYSAGSGDSFLGGLLAALDRDQPLATGLGLAIAAGAANALVPGPGRFEPASVNELSQRVRVTSLG